MKFIKVLMSGAACTLMLSGCGKDDDNKRETRTDGSTSLVYPSILEGKYVSVAGWELILPASGNEAEYRLSPDSFSEVVVTDDIPITALAKDGKSKAEFLVKLTSNQCQDFKTAPYSEEASGITQNGITWFLKNSGQSFESFTATAKFNTCLTMVVRPAAKGFAAIGQDSDLLRYFELVADSIKFNRFFLVRAGYQRISPFLFTSFSKGLMLSTDADGLTSGRSEDTFFAKDARLNTVQSEVMSGDCQKAVFQDVWNDIAMKDAVAVNEGLVAKEKSGIESVDGKYTWVTQGIFKTKDGSKCLLVKFSLKNPITTANVLTEDKALQERLGFELSLTQRDDQGQ